MKCKQCSKDFDLCDEEVEVYGKFEALLPEVCADCRNKRRLIFRNEKWLFRNVSSKSGKQIISTYPKDSPFKILDQDEWWDDEFDTVEYGREFDFERPFFEQFKDLQKEVPRWSRIFINCENSDYTNNSANLKDSYLTFSSYDSENLYYCMRVMASANCVDCLNVRKSNFCSSCLECKNCHNVHFSQMSEGCTDSFYLYDCRNCNDCILSSQLRNKKYMILNKQYSREEYGELKKKFLKRLHDDKENLAISFENLKKKALHRNLRIINSENSLGDFINDSKSVRNGFYVSECEDCVNLYDCYKNKNCYDNLANEKSELALECDTAYELYNAKFCSHVATAIESAYCEQCVNIKNCFGCIGLKKEQYVILNKKYTKEEYEKIMSRINAHMHETGEYGKPFPALLTSFPYNLSAAYFDFPLKKEDAISKGYMWHDEEGDLEGVAVDEKVLRCEVSGKKYKIIPQELEFYKKFNLPLPRFCPQERYKQLCALMPPKKLLDSNCSVCNEPIKTVYVPEAGYKVVCESCYLKGI